MCCASSVGCLRRCAPSASILTVLPVPQSGTGQPTGQLLTTCPVLCLLLQFAYLAMDVLHQQHPAHRVQLVPTSLARWPPAKPAQTLPSTPRVLVMANPGPAPASQCTPGLQEYRLVSPGRASCRQDPARRTLATSRQLQALRHRLSRLHLQHALQHARQRDAAWRSTMFRAATALPSRLRQLVSTPRAGSFSTSCRQVHRMRLQASTRTQPMFAAKVCQVACTCARSSPTLPRRIGYALELTSKLMRGPSPAPYRPRFGIQAPRRVAGINVTAALSVGASSSMVRPACFELVRTSHNLVLSLCYLLGWM